MAHAHFNQKWMSLRGASISVKISLEQDVCSFINVEAWDCWIFYPFHLLQIETGRAPYEILDA